MSAIARINRFVPSAVLLVFLLAGTPLINAYAQEGGDDKKPVAEASAETSAPAAKKLDDAAQKAFDKDMNRIGNMKTLWLITPIGALLALIFAFVFYKKMMSASEGTPEMVEIAHHVRQGAMAYLWQQYKVVTIVFAVLLFLFSMLAFVFEVQNKFVPFAFLTGGFFSGLAGYFGMKTATNASARTTNGCRNSLNEGLQVAFRSGAVMGLTVVGLGLIDIALWYVVLNMLYDSGLVNVTSYSFDVPLLLDSIKGGAPTAAELSQYKEWYHAKMVDITTTMLTFGMGASTQALFARVGGGIFTKAADVGADLVGKVEAGIPEDDPRNPATIADNVGDIVGDVAGMGADLYESYCGSILATAALGAAAWMVISRQQGSAMSGALALVMAPMIIAGIGNIISIISIFFVKTGESTDQKSLLKALGRGVNVATALVLVAVAAVTTQLFPDVSFGHGVKSGLGLQWGIFGSVIMGLAAGWVIGKATEYYTSGEYAPTKGIAQQARMGHATAIIDGIAIGMLSTWIPVITISIAILGAFWLPGGFSEPAIGLYGVGIAAVGMLSTLGITLSTDAYGPIADNAGGNAQMTSQEPIVRERTDALDSLGNTTAATGKGFAIGSAALTALALLAAYMEEVKIYVGKYIGDRGKGYYAVGEDREHPYLFVIGSKTNNTELNDDKRKEVELQTKVLQVNANGSIVRNSLQSLPEAFTIASMNDVIDDFNRKIVDNKYAVKRIDDDESDLKAKRKETAEAMRTNGVAFLKESTPIDKWEEKDYKIAMMASGAMPVRSAELGSFVEAYQLNIMNPLLIVGMFIGAMMTFLFSALTLKAVGRAASAMVEEVRRQFRTKPRIMEYKPGDPDFPESDKPDYAKCVAIATAGAQREMMIPSLLAIIIPITTGLILGIPGVMGLLAGGLSSGFCLAIYMANAGGAWDNAKKSIEQGQMSCAAWLSSEKIQKAKDLGMIEEKDGKIYLQDKGQLEKYQDINNESDRESLKEAAYILHTASFSKDEEMTEIVYIHMKGSRAHKAGVTGDTVGDPFKDTSGPSLNILIKLMSMVSVVAAGLIVAFSLLG